MAAGAQGQSSLAPLNCAHCPLCWPRALSTLAAGNSEEAEHQGQGVPGTGGGENFLGKLLKLYVSAYVGCTNFLMTEFLFSPYE